MEPQDDEHSDVAGSFDENCVVLQQSLQETITQGQPKIAILHTTDNKCQQLPEEIYQQSQLLSKLLDSTDETEKAPIVPFYYDSKTLIITLEYLTIPHKHMTNNTLSRENFNHVNIFQFAC